MAIMPVWIPEIWGGVSKWPIRWENMPQKLPLQLVAICVLVKMSNNKVELNVKNVSYTTTHAMYNIPMLFKKEYSEATKGNVTIYLSEKHFDFKKPIQIVVNGKEVFNGKVKPNLNAMIESCAEFFDPERIFPASVNVDIR